MTGYLGIEPWSFTYGEIYEMFRGKLLLEEAHCGIIACSILNAFRSRSTPIAPEEIFPILRSLREHRPDRTEFRRRVEAWLAATASALAERS